MFFSHKVREQGGLSCAHLSLRDILLVNVHWSPKLVLQYSYTLYHNYASITISLSGILSFDMDIAKYLSGLELLSNQVSRTELGVILRELQRTLEQDITGDVVEFGCYVGTTSVHLAKFLKPTDKQLWLYDSFEGLPEKTREDHSPAGEQFVAGELHATKKQLIRNLARAGVPMPHITKGWFSDITSAQVPDVISFAFLDGDYYRSVLDPLKLIWPKLTSGATIVVDDYANEALPGASRAVDEWLQNHNGRLRVEHSLGIIHT